MTLTRVTLTGADTSVDPQWLVDIAVEFPFVEWGILVGSNTSTMSRIGPARFPTASWIGWLARKLNGAPNVNLSLHICGAPLRSMLEGQWGLSEEVTSYVGRFQRWQLNFHGRPITSSQYESLASVLESRLGSAEVIVQLDAVNDWVLRELLLRGVKASGLYDTSHGAGILPRVWAKANPNWKVGYAGGIGPMNVVEAVAAITQAAAGKEFWIDMETKLRSDASVTNGDYFDTVKCRLVLEKCAPLLSGC